MGIEFGNTFAPTWAGKPPGASPEDYRIWQIWRPREFRRYDKFNFNVRLTRHLILSPELDDKIRKMAEFNAAKRIDVLGWRSGGVDIIELRDNAGLSAIGQLIGYFHLFKRDFPRALDVNMILITNHLDPDVKSTAEQVGIGLELV